MTELAELDRRLRRLEDERAILRVMSAYGATIDYGDADGFAACFSDDGVLELSRPKSSEIAVRAAGRSELRRFAEHHSSAPERWHKHVTVGTSITLQGDEAAANSYYLLLQEHDRTPVVRSFGRYIDQLVRGGTEGWQLRLRRAAVEAALSGLPPLITA
jgi:hypothetical protein